MLFRSDEASSREACAVSIHDSPCDGAPYDGVSIHGVHYDGAPCELASIHGGANRSGAVLDGAHAPSCDNNAQRSWQAKPNTRKAPIEE